MRGIFITIEGPDGAGKTTQRELLKEYLEKKGYDVLITRDPGGNPISEAIREVILNKEFTEMGYMTELLLYASARAQLVKENIKPALEAGQAVIADRFVDSSAVYQGIGRGLGVDTVYKVNEFALQGIMPDMTFLMDLNAQEGIARKKNQAEIINSLSDEFFCLCPSYFLPQSVFVGIFFHLFSYSFLFMSDTKYCSGDKHKSKQPCYRSIISGLWNIILYCTSRLQCIVCCIHKFIIHLRCCGSSSVQAKGR